MRKIFFLPLFFCSLLFAHLEEGNTDSKIKILSITAGSAAEVKAAIDETFPDGAKTTRVAEVGDAEVVHSVHEGLPSAADLAAALTDATVGGHLKGETRTPTDEPIPLNSSKETRSWLPSWRGTLIIARVLVNGGIAAALVALKNHVAQETWAYDRMLANFVVHGGVNGLFQAYGKRVANFAYANWGRVTFFPNFEMSLKDLVLRNLTNALPKRVLLTIASVSIYALTDYAFTGNFSFTKMTFVGILMNILASLAPSATGLEKGAAIGPPQAEGLPARNNKSFDIQNFVISVAFAVGLLTNTKEMNQTFQIESIWPWVYLSVASGGALWWGFQSRWINPTLASPVTLAKRAIRGVGRLCGAALSRIRGRSS